MQDSKQLHWVWEGIIRTWQRIHSMMEGRIFDKMSAIHLSRPKRMFAEIKIWLDEGVYNLKTFATLSVACHADWRLFLS